MAAASMALFFSTCSMSRRDSISSPQFSRLALSRAAPLDKWGGFVSGARSIPIQGLSAPRIRTLSRQLLVAASYDQPVSADVEAEGNIVEGVKEAENIHEAVHQLNGDINESDKSDAELINSLRNSTEELQRQVDIAKESLAGIAKETVEENLSPATEKAYVQEGSRKGAKIHDFCFGIPYGGLLVSGGLMGFLITGNMASILFGFLLGGAILGLSITSLKVWKQGRSSLPYILGQAALTFILLAKQLQIYSLTKNVFPTGLVTIISAAMLSFYSYVYFSGGNPPSKKLRAASMSQAS